MKKKVDSSTEEKIMEAAKVVFMNYGLYGARMQDIADKAGINKALLHYYFRSKERLFDKVFEGALQKYFQQIDVFSDESLPIKERMFRYIDNIVPFLSEYPHMSLFIIKEISTDPELFKQKVQGLKRNKNAGLISVLEKEMAAGRLKKFDAVLFFINLQSLCAYPFIAAPLHRLALKAHGKDWNKDFSNEKLKQSVKNFVEHTFGK
ncbi:MAG: TetR/AcrR family transcriptional regulator [Bacteroidia bacterium]